MCNTSGHCESGFKKELFCCEHIVLFSFFFFATFTYKTPDKFKILFVLNSRKRLRCYTDSFKDLRISLRSKQISFLWSKFLFRSGICIKQRLLLPIILIVKLHECVRCSQFKCAKECSLYAEQINTI